jgi:hypothetical protein
MVGIVTLVALVVYIGLWVQQQRVLEFRRERRMQCCAGVWNEKLKENYAKWIHVEGRMSYLSWQRLRDMTPEEIGVQDWETPADYERRDLRWQDHHSDAKEIMDEMLDPGGKIQKLIDKAEPGLEEAIKKLGYPAVEEAVRKLRDKNLCDWMNS